jgi:molecular chaperone DnaJ
MHVKDYYKTLGLTHTASQEEIKKSFRKLALVFHPDKKQGDALAEANFKEIQEAYAVLSDPRQREEYNYKRWYVRSLGKPYNTENFTPQAIRRECERLGRYVQAMNIFQLDHESLNYHIHQLLSSRNLLILQQYGDPGTRTAIIEVLLQSSESLPFRYIPALEELLRQIAGTDLIAQGKIDEFVAWQQKNERWRKWRFPLVGLVTLLLCWIIFRLANG